MVQTRRTLTKVQPMRVFWFFPSSEEYTHSLGTLAEVAFSRAMFWPMSDIGDYNIFENIGGNLRNAQTLGFL